MLLALLWVNHWLWVVAIENGDSGSMSLNIGPIVSGVVGPMMGILVGSWNIEVGQSMTINTSFSSDSDSELMNFISESIAPRNGGRINMTVWSSTGGNEGY